MALFHLSCGKILGKTPGARGVCSLNAEEQRAVMTHSYMALSHLNHFLLTTHCSFVPELPFVYCHYVANK